MRFTKMHGAGNDYIYVNCFEEEVEDPAAAAVKLSDRHFGVGGDGLVLIMPSKVADVRMRMFNADGSEGMMCGNAIRCVGKYAYENGLVRDTTITVETASGIKTLWLNLKGGLVAEVTVNMGEPVLEPEKIPMNAKGESFINQRVAVGGREYRATAVSMGNPHWVFFVDDIDSLDLDRIGPLFESHSLFPERVNTEFVKIEDGRLRMRVWERGSGETLACGTGACASLVAAALNGLSPRSSKVVLKGGELFIDWRGDNCVYMTGPAEIVFTGEVEL